MPWKQDSCDQPLLTPICCTRKEGLGYNRAIKGLPLNQGAWVLILASFSGQGLLFFVPLSALGEVGIPPPWREDRVLFHPEMPEREAK